MSDKIEDSQGHYNAKSHDELKEFVDNAIEERLKRMAQEDEKRSLRFQSDAVKLRAAHDKHASAKPDPANFGKTNELEDWNETLLELERRAQTAERQYRVHRKSLEEPNKDLQRRQARVLVEKEFPTEYREYQESLKRHRYSKLSNELVGATDKLDELIVSGARKGDIITAANKVIGIAKRIEKSEVFENEANADVKRSLEKTKAKSNAAIEASRGDFGLDR